MKEIQKVKYLFRLSVIALFLMSSTILLMPLPINMGENYRIMTVLLGSFFWGTAIIGYVSIFLAARERKRLIKNKIITEDKNDFPGIRNFFSNQLAKVADVTMILSIIVFVIINFTDLIYEYIAYIIMFLLIFSLNMHCLLNGRIYKIANLNK